MISSILKNIGDKFSFFTIFEKHISIVYMILLLSVSLFFIYKNKKTVFHIDKKLTYFLLGIIIICSSIIILYSPFSDFNDSRSEDYKIAAKYYADESKYHLCSYGNSDECYIEKKMDKNTGYPFIISLLYKFNKNYSNATIYFNFIISIIGLLLMFLTSVNLFRDRLFSFLLIVLLCLNPLFLKYSTQSTVMMITILSLSLVFYLITSNINKNRKEVAELLPIVLLWLSFFRAEYFLLTILYLIYYLFDNKKTIKNYIKNNKESTFFIIFITFSYMIIILFHLLTETQHHTGTDEIFFLPSQFFFRFNVIYKSLFLNNIIGIALTLCIISSLFNRNFKKFLKYPLSQITIFGILILTFHSYQERFLAILIPSIMLLAGMGLRHGIIKRSSQFLLIILIIVSFFSLRPIDMDYSSTHNFDRTISKLNDNNTLIINEAYAMQSRCILLEKYNIDCIYLETGNFQKIFENKNYTYKYFIDIPAYKNENLILENYKIKEVFRSGELTTYKLID
ncbi:MAG: hypothetical protein ACLFUO_02935 [Candidatus Woesearchaeota archaeon]